MPCEFAGAFFCLLYCDRVQYLHQRLVGAGIATRGHMAKNLTPKANGRPRLFETPEQFDAKVEEYQLFCEAKEYPVTWTGLALYLGFSSRQSIDEYLNYEGFSDSVKRAKAFVEWHYEMKLHGSSPTGSIFALKNFGWSDKAESADVNEDLAEAISELIKKLPS